jgi:hypothetical protein
MQDAGSIISQAVFILGIVYAITTTIGLLALESPDQPIGDPFFTIMELLTVLIAPLMAFSLTAVHNRTMAAGKTCSLIAVLLMFAAAGITSCVHLVVLVMSRIPEAMRVAGHDFLFSFKWPSVVYVLDILAWDWFFGLSMLFAAVAFKEGRLEKSIRRLMLFSGLLSLAGFAGVPQGDMQVRNIGIAGYALLGPVAFLLIGKWLRRERGGSEGLPHA